MLPIGVSFGALPIWVSVFTLPIWVSVFMLPIWVPVYILPIWVSAYILPIWVSVYILPIWVPVYILPVWVSADTLPAWVSVYMLPIILTYKQILTWVTYANMLFGVESYETKSTTKLGYPFSFGITIHNIQLITTTNKKRMGKVKENTLVIAELKEIKWLSLYWITNCTSRIHMSLECVLDDLKSKTVTGDNISKTDEMNYVVMHPTNINLELKVIIKLAEQNFERPTFKVEYNIAQMGFEIDPKQFSDLLDFVKFQNYSVFYDRCREYRQLCLQDLIGNIKLTKEEQERIEILESKLDVFTMAYIRHSLELEIHLYSNTNSNEDYSWWSWWWNERTNVDQDHHKIIKGNMNNEEEFFSEELLDIDAEAKINRLEFTLLSPTRKTKFNDKNKIISHIIIDNTQIDYKRRAISSIFFERLGIDLGYFRIFGFKSNANDQALILTSTCKSLNSLIRIEFELAPINKKSDYRFLLAMEPMAIIYHAKTINEIATHFEPVNDDDCFLSSESSRLFCETRPERSVE
ncbi:unnamed protein product, partial [Rotaria magnacalcarata]